MQILYLLAA